MTRTKRIEIARDLARQIADLARRGDYSQTRTQKVRCLQDLVGARAAKTMIAKAAEAAE